MNYQPYYCEENVWWLCAEPQFASHDRRVVFISNPHRTVFLRHQRAGGPDGVVFWDYHVVLAVNDDGWKVWDLDTRLGMPLPAARYLDETFAGVAQLPTQYHPQFRVIEGQRFAASFSTDRSHMRDEQGGWQKEPPPWDPPQALPETTNLMQYVDMENDFDGDLLDLGGVRQYFR